MLPPAVAMESEPVPFVVMCKPILVSEPAVESVGAPAVIALVSEM